MRVFWDDVLQIDVPHVSSLPDTRAGLVWNGYDPHATADNFEVNSNLAPMVSLIIPASAAPFTAPATIPLV